MASGPGRAGVGSSGGRAPAAVGGVRAAWSGHVRVRTPPPPPPPQPRPGPPPLWAPSEPPHRGRGGHRHPSELGLSLPPKSGEWPLTAASAPPRVAPAPGADGGAREAQGARGGQRRRGLGAGPAAEVGWGSASAPRPSLQLPCLEAAPSTGTLGRGSVRRLLPRPGRVTLGQSFRLLHSPRLHTQETLDRKPPQDRGEILGGAQLQDLTRARRFACIYKVVIVTGLNIAPSPVFAFFGGSVGDPARVLYGTSVPSGQRLSSAWLGACV